MPVLSLAGSLLIAASTVQDVKERQVKDWVVEYVAEATNADRRAVLLEQLKRAKPVMAQKSLQSAIGDEKKRARALELAIAVGTPGLYQDAKKYIDGPDEDQVVKLLLITQDAGAASFLCDRWTKAAIDSASFRYVDEGFRQHGVRDPAVLTRLEKVVQDAASDRREKAAEVLAWQYGSDAAELNALLADLPKLRSAYQRDAKTFPISGVDLLQTERWEHKDTRPAGRNVRIRKGGSLVLKPMPDSLQAGSYTIKARVLVKRAGLHCAINMDWNGEQKNWAPQVMGKEWVLPEGTGKRTATPAKFDAWSELTLQVTDKSEGATKYDRRLRLAVDGTVLMEDGLLTGRLIDLRFEARDGEMVVGGVEIAK